MMVPPGAAACSPACGADRAPAPRPRGACRACWRGPPSRASLSRRQEGPHAAMPTFDSVLNAFVTILVTIDPPGLAPLFLAVTPGMNREERHQVSIRASVIGFAVLALFAVGGAAILSVFGITLPAFRVAGGFLLFVIAYEMVFEKRNDRKEKIS